MTVSGEGRKPSEDGPHGHNDKSNDPYKPPEEGPELEDTRRKSYFDLEDFQDISDYVVYNPLSDFIYIKGHAYAIRSALSKVPVAAQNKSGEIVMGLVTVWKTDYINEKGEINSVRINKLGESENKIGGHVAIPLFTAEEFEKATRDYKMLLKHTNRLNRNPLKVEDIKKVFHWVENAVSSVLTITEDDSKAISCWIIAAHFHRVFSQFPPLIFGKPGFDSGGTVALTATSLIPFPVSIFDPTEATLFRLAQMGFSLLIDEVDPEYREKVKALNLILDGSFNKDAGIPRASGKGFTVEGFLPYSPKVTIDPQMAIVKYSTLSRSVRPFLRKDPKRSETLNISEFIDKYRYLANDLYDLFLPYAHKVRKTYEEITELTGRQKQAYAPVLAIAKLTGCEKEVLLALDLSIKNLQMQKEGDPTKYVLNSLYAFLLEKRTGLAFTEFSQTKDKSAWYIQLSKMREILKERTAEIHQTDESEMYDRDGVAHMNKRQWKKVPSEFKMFFEGQKFNGIVMSVLGKWIERVRGDRYGLLVDANPDEGEPLDPVLDELEKVLEVKNSYSKGEGKNDVGDVSDYEHEDDDEDDIGDL